MLCLLALLLRGFLIDLELLHFFTIMRIFGFHKSLHVCYTARGAANGERTLFIMNTIHTPQPENLYWHHRGIFFSHLPLIDRYSNIRQHGIQQSVKYETVYAYEKIRSQNFEGWFFSNRSLSLYLLLFLFFDIKAIMFHS
jgi:hypothetical protein